MGCFVLPKVINFDVPIISYRWGTLRRTLFLRKFEWQDDYFAVSVSESAINKVRNYIKNQEYHHKKKSFNNEYPEFIRSYKFDAYVSS